MQITINLSEDILIKAIKQLSINELEILKTAIIEQEIYFKKFKNDEISAIIDDFSKEGYSSNFLDDLENGLKKSSVYNENYRIKN